MDWGTLAQVGLNMASNYAAGRNQARGQAAVAQNEENRNAIAQNSNMNNVMLQMAQMELLRKQMEESNRQNRAQQVARGDLLARMQDINIEGPSHITKFNVSGGMRPSALGPNARAAGGELSNQALAALIEGDSFMPIKPMGPVNLSNTMPQESTFDKIMGMAGTVGGAMDAYKQRQQAEQQGQAMQDLWSRVMGVQGGAGTSYQQSLAGFRPNMGAGLG